MPNQRLSLDGEWTLSWADPTLPARPAPRAAEKNIPVQVPGDVHQALMQAGLIPEPVIGDNFRDLGWIGRKAWWFTRRFAAPDRRGGAAELNFLGLDHEADVWLNGVWLGQHRNTYRPWRIPVADYLQAGNELVVHLRPYRTDADRLPPLRAEEATILPPGYVRRRPWMRKPAYTFGWNWTCELCTCGIWRPVFLELIDRAIVEEAFVRAEPLAGGRRARVRARCLTRSFCASTTSAVLRVTVQPVFPVAGKAVAFEKAVWLAPGHTEHALEFSLENPALWFPAGYGPQNLYAAEFQIIADGERLATTAVRFGIRSVTIDERPAKAPGRYRFAFVINGRPVYAQGANWVPADILFARVTDERRKRLLTLARKAHFNYLRVWGGGLYEDPQFYRLCDELGLMVWQDFMFACSEYPDFDPAFTAEVELEATEAVKRLRNHPSIIIWCGNNEIYQCHCHEASRARRPNGCYYGENLFLQTIPAVLAKLDQSRPYRNSSGCRGLHRESRVLSPEPRAGVAHMEVYNEVWKAGPKTIPSFVNEWYAGSPPVMKSVAQSLPRAAWNWQGETWRRRDWISERWAAPFQRITPITDLSFEERVGRWQVFHAELMQGWIELLRKHRAENSGHCAWMYNDAYPGATKAIVDYYLREKPAFFAARRAGRPVIVTAEDTGREYEIAVVNATLQPLRGTVRGEIIAFTGQVLQSFRKKIAVPPGQARVGYRLRKTAVGATTDRALWLGIADARGQIVSANRFFFDAPARLTIPLAELNVRYHQRQGRLTALTLFSDRFVRNVWIEGRQQELDLSDNAFDIFPGHPVQVTISPAVAPEEITLAWDNRDVALADCLKPVERRVACASGAAVVLDIPVFNPAPAPRVFTIVARPPAGLTCRPERAEVTVAPGVLQAVPLTLTAGVAAGETPSGNLAVSLEENGASRTISIPVAITPPLTLTLSERRGRLALAARNESTARLDGLTLAASWESAAAGLVAKTFPPFTLEAGASLTSEVPLDRNVLPFSFLAEIRTPWNRTYTISSWLKSGGSAYEKVLPVQPMALPLTVRPAPPAGRPRLLTGPAYRLAPGEKAVAFTGRQSVRALLWLNYSPRCLYLDLLAVGERFWNPFDRSEFFRGTSLEIGLSCGNELQFEAVLGAAGKEAALYVRRQYGNRLGRVLAPPRLVVLHHAQTVYFGLALEWGQVQTDWVPAPGRRLRCAFAINGKHSHLRLFEGIQGGKDIGLYGEAVLG